mmetsp:Transcript_8087/g.10532  ORF Transcript_8087/g.10532 Transcript_8087/m.10532 type:complete len:157 (+) Transcript_8087:238-708(+)|eukprot:CAMPEP_0184019346 /NCGR_PEP_ID=MMETSP0954-20121128/8697_1 /TAXON_ID=627963 /ORGANISM="Aplanochytrium sp, Strain PBS07" /LENGTH=156 /DNA_ID=CAMNT_0026300995 /DNA_START=181 /DNA_END=651 /DNA_ORIENTATION=-
MAPVEEAPEKVVVEDLEERIEAEALVGGKYPSKDASDDAIIDMAFHAVGPFLTRFGFGGFLGFCSGYAIKQASKVAAILFGVTFVGLQGLQYAGYIEIKWSKIKADGVKLMDSDGTGTVGVKDLKYYVKRFVGVLKFHGPSATGLTAGLYYGFYKG